MALPQQKTYTIDDIYALPEGQHAELIEGQIYYMAPPNPFHQELVMELSAAIRQHIRDKGGNCKVYPAPLAVKLHANDKTWVEPDISVICDKNKITETACEGFPVCLFCGTPWIRSNEAAFRPIKYPGKTVLLKLSESILPDSPFYR